MWCLVGTKCSGGRQEREFQFELNSSQLDPRPRARESEYRMVNDSAHTGLPQITTGERTVNGLSTKQRDGVVGNTWNSRRARCEALERRTNLRSLWHRVGHIHEGVDTVAHRVHFLFSPPSLASQVSHGNRETSLRSSSNSFAPVQSPENKPHVVMVRNKVFPSISLCAATSHLHSLHSAPGLRAERRQSPDRNPPLSIFL